MGVEIRQLDDSMLADYKAIRLEALRHAPDAFSSDEEVEAAQDDEYHRMRLQAGAVYGAYDEGKIVGMIGVIFYTSRKMQHRAAIWGVYVSPKARGHGVGGALMKRAMGDMPGHIKFVTLGVGTHNEKAFSLYQAMGFETYGCERMALIDGDKIYDEHLMVKFL